MEPTNGASALSIFDPRNMYSMSTEHIETFRIHIRTLFPIEEKFNRKNPTLADLALPYLAFGELEFAIIIFMGLAHSLVLAKAAVSGGSCKRTVGATAERGGKGKKTDTSRGGRCKKMEFVERGRTKKRGCCES
jgi:hypothetical protein